MSGSARYPARGPYGLDLSDHPDPDKGSPDAMLERARAEARKVGIAEGIERAAQFVANWNGETDDDGVPRRLDEAIRALSSSPGFPGGELEPLFPEQGQKAADQPRTRSGAGGGAKEHRP